MGIEEKSPEIRYLTHMIVFPDEDAFIEQKPFVHDLQFELSNWQHLPPFNNPSVDFADCSRELLKKGEYVFTTRYPPGGITAKLTHRLIIEERERKTGWFGTPKGFENVISPQ